MCHIVRWRIVVVGLVAFCTLSLPRVGVIAEERESEHVLFQAVRRGDTTLLKDILRRGTPPDVRAGDGTTALMYAALHGSAEMVGLLLEHGADPRAVNERGVTALLWGARDVDKVRPLIRHGADANAASKLGNTPLMVAAGSPDGALAVESLLAHGADLTPGNKSGRTALRFAVNGGNQSTVRLLIAKALEQEKLEELIRDAGPTIANAANNGFHDLVKLLLENGADVNRSTGSRGHGLNHALMSGSTDIARTLILHGADLGGRTGETPTAVLAAYAEIDDASTVGLLKERGVDFTAVNEDKQTALTWARMRGHRQLIDALREAGAPEGEMPKRPEIPSRSIEHGVDQAQLVTRAVQKSVDLLQLSSDTFLDVRGNCVSCHHQNVPGVAIGWARDRGFHVRQASIQRIIERQVKSWEPRIDRAYQLDAPFPVPPRFLGWGMWSFAELGHRPDELTRAVSWYLAATQQPDGRWVPGMLRPPLGGNEILATMLGMRSLQLYPLSGREEETAERIGRARRWLQDAGPRTHQDEVSRMLGLAWAGVEPDGLADEVERLLEAQRDDGGWAQLPGLESDAWATGLTLVALHTAGGVPTDQPAYRRGVEMLLRTQFDDGSWFVQARSWPFQPYFESKFPYGRDQWISAPATAWAAMALMLTVDPSDVARLNVAREAEVPAPSTIVQAEQDGRAAPEKPVQLVPAATRSVEFSTDIEPLFARSCLGCHGEKKPKSNFSLTSREALLRGGDSELPAILSGASHDSPLVRFAAGVEPEMEMPPVDSRDKYPPLSREEIALLRAWIDQGAKWPTAVTGDVAPGDIAPVDKRWEFASKEWCDYAAELGVKMLEDAKLNLSEHEWGFSEEYTHTPERLMAGRDLAGYYFMIKDGKISGGAGVPQECLDLPGFHVKIAWGLIAHPSSFIYGKDGSRQRSVGAKQLSRDLKAAGKGSKESALLGPSVWPRAISAALSVDAENGGGLHNFTAKHLKHSPEVKNLPQTEWGVPILTKMTDQQKEGFYKLIGR